MDSGEDCKSLHGRSLSFIPELGLIRAGLVKELENAKLRLEVVTMKLVEAPVFVPEHTVGSVHALFGAVERPAVVGFELISVAQNCGLRQFLLAMRIPTFALEAALGGLDPVPAQLGLILAVGVGHEKLERHWIDLAGCQIKLRRIIERTRVSGLVEGSSRNEIARGRLERIG